MSPMSDERTFTFQELEQFNGKDGQPAYTAVDGVVYDVTASKMWREGLHVRKHFAGQDMSGDILLAPHSKDRLDRFPRVGVLAESAPKPAASEMAVPFFPAFMYKKHAHPASVHFPIALIVVAVLLDFLGVGLAVTGCCGDGALWFCGCASVVNLFSGVLLAPMAIVSGLMDWKYQFDGAMSRLFQWKIGLSVLFMVVAGLALVLRLTDSGGPVYHLLLWSLAPMVLALGFVGGKITFPAG